MNLVQCTCLIILCFCTKIQATKYANCQTANGKPGFCVPVQECKKLIKQSLLDGQKSLVKHQCDWQEEQGPFVCCENGCVTPNGKTGICERISQCPKIKHFILNNYVPNSVIGALTCGWNAEVLVCCSEEVYKDLVHSAVKSHGLPNSESCGNQGTFNKILDGSVAGIDEFPWLARLEYRNHNGESAGYGCGGVLISNRYVLTAAHCISFPGSHKKQIYSVRLGEYNTSSARDCVEMLGFKDCADFPIDVPVEEYIAHPNHFTHLNDIAILRLSRPVVFSDFIQPICLPTDNDVVQPGERLWVSGWGQTESGADSNVKLKLSIPTVSTAECNFKYEGRGFRIGPGHICAGSEKGRDACTGDSGSPLMLSASHSKSVQWKVMGIVSSGRRCGMSGWPGIYTKVTHHLDWIWSHLRE